MHSRHPEVYGGFPSAKGSIWTIQEFYKTEATHN